MSIVIETDSPPLRRDADGSLRVGGTRVLVELVIQAFERGASPEHIAGQFDTLDVADVYGVIAYYLRHPEDIGMYLAERDALAAGFRRRGETGDPAVVALRERVRSRRARQ